MAAISPSRVTILDDCVDLAQVDVVDQGPIVLISPKEATPSQAAVESLLYRLGNCTDKAKFYLKKDVPARLEYSSNPRIEPIVGISNLGWLTITRERFQLGIHGGDHGFDNIEQDMGALFIAKGPSFKNNGQLHPAFDNIHVAPLLAKLMGVTIPSNVQGSWQTVANLLK
eukprot:GILI01023327.1.p1 GENE.GILI01023327.1~~GILI01023327.1.p1  ORF type:complete len:193 (+),score=66.14 GILI01023327.1:72-581(+)